VVDRVEHRDGVRRGEVVVRAEVRRGARVARQLRSQARHSTSVVLERRDGVRRGPGIVLERPSERGDGVGVERTGVVRCRVEDGPGILGEVLSAGRLRVRIDGRPIV